MELRQQAADDEKLTQQATEVHVVKLRQRTLDALKLRQY